MSAERDRRKGFKTEYFDEESSCQVSLSFLLWTTNLLSVEAGNIPRDWIWEARHLETGSYLSSQQHGGPGEERIMNQELRQKAGQRSLEWGPVWCVIRLHWPSAQVSVGSGLSLGLPCGTSWLSWLRLSPHIRLPLEAPPIYRPVFHLSPPLQMMTLSPRALHPLTHSQSPLQRLLRSEHLPVSRASSPPWALFCGAMVRMTCSWDFAWTRHIAEFGAQYPHWSLSALRIARAFMSHPAASHLPPFFQTVGSLKKLAVKGQSIF